MAYTKIEKGNWQAFFDRISRSVEGQAVELEVAGLDVGDQVESDGMTLNGITYDPYGDALYLALEGEAAMHLDHVIHSPKDIYVDQGDRGICQLVVVEEEGQKQFVTLRQPLSVPGA